MPLTSQQLIDAINNTEGYKARSYSGRFMFGAYCVGVYVENMNSAMNDIIDTNSRVKGLRKILESGNSETLGKGRIWYFPNFDWPQDN